MGGKQQTVDEALPFFSPVIELLSKNKLKKPHMTATNKWLHKKLFTQMFVRLRFPH
jgi:hypothetical protein